MKKLITMMLLFATLLTTLSVVSCGEEKIEAKIIDIALTQEEYAFGVAKDQPELLEKVNELIKEMKSTGTFDEICNHYFGDGTPEAVKSAKLDTSKDQLVVATHAEFAPFEYRVGDSYYGIDMEIAALLADELGLELVIKDMEFKDVLDDVAYHGSDIVMSAMTVKEERKSYVTFSDPYYQASQKLIIKSDDKAFDGCKTADDVLKKLQSYTMSTVVGYQAGTIGEMFVKSQGDYSKNNLLVTGMSYENGTHAVQAMLKGDIHYVIIDAAVADRIVTSVNSAQ